MARTVAEIRQSITDAYVANMAAIGYVVDVAAWSVTDLRRLFIDVVALCSYTLETLLDLHVQETDNKIKELKPHSPAWYAGKAKAFQYGFDLLPDSDQFDNTGYTESEIEASRIVKYSAVIEQADNYGRLFLRMKIATDSGADLAPLSTGQLNAFKDYIKRVKDAGVKVQAESLPADLIRQQWRVYYDPLILSSTGSRIDGKAASPVHDAVKNYLKNLPFNGIYVPQYHTDEVQAVPGVVIAELDECEVKYGARPYEQVQTKYTPDAGYLRFASDDDLVIEFIPLSPIK